MRTILTRAALAAALATLVSAAAAQADTRYAVEVTGIQVTDWSYQSSTYPDELSGWAKNWGSQTLGFSTPRPFVFEGIEIPQLAADLPDWVLLGPMNRPRVKGTASRKATVTHKDPLPVCEGGDLDPECLFVPLPGGTKQTGCGRRTPQMTIGFEVPDTLGGELVVETRVEDGLEYAKCAPDGDSLVEREQLEATFKGALRKWRALRRGQTLKLRHEAESKPGCPLPSTARNQLDTCVVTDVTVEITRTR